MLAMREDVDFRLIYMDEVRFQERVRDVYVAKQTMKKPPKFKEILEELMDIQASLFLQHEGERVFGDFTQEERERMLERIDAEDLDTLDLVYERFNPRFIEMFAQDLFLYLMANQFMFFEEDILDRHHIDVHNSCLQQVW